MAESEVKKRDKITVKKNRFESLNLPTFPKKSSTPQSSVLLLKPQLLKLPENVSLPKTSFVEKKQSDNNYSKNVDEQKSPIKQSTVDKKRKPSTYEYIKLNDILQLYPLSSMKMVSIYGIIVAYNEDGFMTLMDETIDKFRFYPNFISSNINDSADTLNDDEHFIISKIPFKTGDIIRVHRLALNTDMTRRSTGLKNIVIFRSFCEERFKPFSLAKSPTYEDYDNRRVEELTKLQVRYLLLEPLVKKLPNNPQCQELQAAFQVLDVLIAENRTIVCCWTPCDKLTEQYRCYPVNSGNLKLENIVKKMEENQALHPLPEPIIRKLYHKKMLVYLVVLGRHRSTTKTLKTCDTIVVFNMNRKPDQFYPGYYSYLLYDGTTYGQCIRVAEYNSEIAKTFREKMENYVDDPPESLEMNLDDCMCSYTSKSFYRRPFYDNFQNLSEPLNSTTMIESKDNQINLNSSKFNNPIEILPPIFDDENNLNDLREEGSREFHSSSNSSFSSHLNNSSSEYHTTIEDRTDLVVAIDPNESFGGYSSEELLLIEEHRKSHKLQYSNQSMSLVYSIKDIHHLSLNSCVRLQANLYTYFGKTKTGIKFFDQIESLQSFAMIVKCLNARCPYLQSLDSHRRMTYGPLDYVINRLRCPQCFNFSCEVCLDISLILQDNQGQLLDCRWTDLNANQYFNCQTKDLYYPNDGEIEDSNQPNKVLFKIKTLLKHLWKVSRQNILPSYDKQSINHSPKIFWTLLIVPLETSLPSPDGQLECRILDVEIS